MVENSKSTLGLVVFGVLLARLGENLVLHVIAFIRLLS